MRDQLIFQPEAFPSELLMGPSSGPWAGELDELEEERGGRAAPPARGGFSARRAPPGRPGGMRRRPPGPPRPPRPRPRWPRPGGPWLGGYGVAAPDRTPEGSEHARWIQDCLNRAMSAQLPVDGTMTPAVRSLVRSFQRQQGLHPNGIVGPDTEEALKRACSGAAEPAPGDAPADGGAGDAGELSDLFGRVKQGIGGAFGRVAGALGSTSAPNIIDLMAVADKSVRKGTRDPKTVYALVLHQMACCFRPKDPLKRFLSLGAHFAILPDGRILQLHPVSALVWASNGFNNRSVAVEFAGNFPNTRGRWWKGETYGANRPTAEQFASGRALIRHLIRTIGITHVVAHRQSSGTRENDPGPDIWYQVGQWAVDSLGLKDGGPGFKIGTGNPIPAEWRTWGQRPVVPEVSTAFEAELPETEIAHDAWQGTDREDALYLAREQLALETGSPYQEAGSLGEAGVPAAIKGALSKLPAAQRPQYKSVGRLADAINKVSGPGLYLLTFNVDGKRKAYSGKSVDVRRRLMQHRLCAQMLGLSADDHRVHVAPMPAGNLRSTEKAIHTHVKNTNPAALTNQRRELEAALLGEAWT